MKRHLGQEHINMHMGTSTKGTKLLDSLSLYYVFYTFIANDRAREKLADCHARCKLIITHEQTFLYIMHRIKFLH